MKKKKLVLTLILVFLVILLLNASNVQAYTGELAPDNFITFPEEILIDNKTGTGTVMLSPELSGYNISYQKVDITKEQRDKIEAKSKEANNYIEEKSKVLKEKETNLANLRKTYEDLQADSNATEAQLTTARTNYETAYNEYTEYYTNEEKQIEKLKNEYLALVPNYTSSWKSTTNSADNIKLDLSNYTGTAHFVLWVKADNGTKAYYKFSCYSTDIKEETEPKEETETEPKSENTDGSGAKANTDWTDFSKAKFELKKQGTSDAIIEISGVTPIENNLYYINISSNKNKPNIDEINLDDEIGLNYDKNSKKFVTYEADKLANYVERNQDLYASVIELNGSKKSIVSYGNKLTRYSEPKYADGFFATYMSSEGDQIVTTFTHGQSNNRKILIKVGKITDISILKKIKSKNAAGFEELLNYAKSNSSLYNQTIFADKNDGFAIEYNAGSYKNTNNSIISIKGLEDEAYYFLYVKTDDENGKYISNEAVTLAQASTPAGHWYLHFLGSDDFKWADWDEVDTSIAPKIFPKTGVKYAMYGISILIAGLSVFIAYKKYNKYNF